MVLYQFEEFIHLLRAIIFGKYGLTIKHQPKMIIAVMD